jgi:hypothetical protein
MGKKLNFDLFFLASHYNVEGDQVMDSTEFEVDDGQHVEGWELVAHKGNLAVLLVTSETLPAKTVGFNRKEQA